MNARGEGSSRPDTVDIRMSRRTMWIIARCLGIVVGVMWLLMALSQIGIIHNTLSPGDRIAFSAAWAAFYIAYFAALSRRRVVLRRDRIDITGALLPTRSIRLDDISARRTDVQLSRAHPPVLILKDGREAKLPAYLEHNDVFSAWLRTLPYRQRRR
jgi:hypothetical protein